MKKDDNFTWILNAQNIGPYTAENSLKTEMELTSSKVVVYATNGTGKTTLSRMFRAAETNGQSVEDSDITLGKNNGVFSFTVKKATGKTQTLSIKCTKGKEATVDNDTEYIFHTFNSDYVDENVEQSTFSLPNNISGAIIGAKAIDTARDKETLKEKIDLLEQCEEDLRNFLEEEKRSLKTQYNIGNNNALNSFTLNRFLEIPENSRNSFDSAKTRYTEFSNLPDNITPVEVPSFQGDFDCNNLNMCFSTSYFRSELDSETENQIKSHLEFFRAGINLLDSSQNCCPFCKQNLEKATTTIDTYKKYFNSEEAEVVTQLEKYTKKLDDLLTVFRSTHQKFEEANHSFEQLKNYSNALRQQSYKPIPPIEDFSKTIEHLKEEITAKKNNVSATITSSHINVLQEYLESIPAILDKATLLRKDLVNELSHKGGKKTDLRRELCVEKAKQLRSEKQKEVAKISELKETINRLEKEIQEKESETQVEKKAVRTAIFSELLTQFFGEKYKFNPKDSTLTLRNEPLGKQAKKILSDGERTIVAFAHYISSVVERIDYENDTEQLFFIIDDPISSLDFDYVYAVAQVIRNLNKYIKKCRPPQRKTELRMRFIILTHNPSFFNVIAKNHIATQHFLLSKKGIEKYEQDAILPYDSHLRDVYSISKADGIPCHTTGNSIRHILETMWHFEAPKCGSLGEYFNQHCTNLANTWIYTLCHDTSHGGLNETVSKEKMKEACDTLIKFVEEKYPYQLEAYL